MCSLFTGCCEDRLSIVSCRTYQRTNDLRRDLVVDFDGVRTVFLPDETEGNGRSARFDVTPPQRCQSVRVIISGIPVVSNPQQAPLQEPDDCGRHDPGGQWIPPVVSQVDRYLMVQGGNARGEERHALELAVSGKIGSGGRVPVLSPTALVDPRDLHGRTDIGRRPHVDPCGWNGQPLQSFEYSRVIHRRASLVDPPVGPCCYPVKAGRPEGPGHSTQSEILFPHLWTHSNWLTHRGSAGPGTPWSLGTRTCNSDLAIADDGRADDGPFASGTGPVATGSTLALVMSMAGRGPYVEQLEGPGPINSTGTPQRCSTHRISEMEFSTLPDQVADGQPAHRTAVGSCVPAAYTDPPDWRS